jgi:hypothetical protein
MIMQTLYEVSQNWKELHLENSKKLKLIWGFFSQKNTATCKQLFKPHTNGRGFYMTFEIHYK